MSRVVVDPSRTLSSVLAELGLEHRRGNKPGTRDVLRRDEVLLADCTAAAVWEWLRGRHVVPCPFDVVFVEAGR